MKTPSVKMFRIASKIPATIQIRTLIEVQKRSHHRFLQTTNWPSEREDAACRRCSRSRSITHFRNVSQLEFVDYAIGNWELQVRPTSKDYTTSAPTREVVAATPTLSPTRSIPVEALCGKCGAPTTPTRPHFLKQVRRPGWAAD